ncbi:hypothetical protein JVU11DRAFT_1622 [Chiua virens]|nr:hypothetical protein JVU11DRAFT_1622 [Chiua virens]
MSSMYSQPPVYGQVTYPAPGYQSAVTSYSYQQPPQPAPPVYHVDPNSFRRDFTARLAELTINSRPIIQTLSMFAQEYSRWADVVAQCIDAHIRRVPPWMKLPAFYLLDAVSKNVFDPYARHFAPFAIPLFLDTYQQVDQATRSKMEEMLLTWRTGAPSGKELFGVITQLAIERGVWGGDSASSLDGHSSGQVSKVQVLTELEFTLGQKERALQVNPWDVTAQKHVEVLQQLRKLVETGVSQDELRQILSQLRSLTRAPQAPPQALAAPPSSYPPSTSTYPYSQQPSYGRHFHSTYATAPPPQPPAAYNYPAEVAKSEPMNLSALLSSVQSSSPPSTVPAIPSTNITSLYNALLKAGVVSTDSTPIGAGSNHDEERTPPPSSSLSRDNTRAYRKAVLSERIKLTTTDIVRKRPSVVSFLYDRLPAQCKQCGMRFSDDASGKRAMDDHLDMHFRQNRKVNQNQGRGHNRSWLVSIEDWLHEGTSDVKVKRRADGTRPTSLKAAAVAEAAQRDAELRAQFVVVPPGDEAKSISCSICKEAMKSEFLEEDEEWVWRNAVKRDDKIYHATCYSEAMSSAQNLAARLRDGRSRSRTPEVVGIRSTPSKGSSQRTSLSPSSNAKRAMLKRKIVSDDQSSEVRPGDQVDSTPPMKKLALSS